MKINVDGEERKFRSVWFEKDEVVLIEQRNLPEKIEFYRAKNSDDIAYAIKHIVHISLSNSLPDLYLPES